MIVHWIGLAVGLLCLYLLHVNRSLSSAPKNITALSPHRLSVASIKATHQRLLKNPITYDLPPKTNRKYIVVGGAGFLSGWIVLQLLARGEDPKRIRIVDVRPPTRRDLTTGLAAEVAFLKADVSDPDAVMAAFTAPWPDLADVPITVFHSAANIRFWERVKGLLPLSWRVNVQGTQNVVVASLKIGASTLVFTSSASITVRRTRFWIWPWEKYPKKFVQVLDDDSRIPNRHEDFFSNYAVSKAEAERIVRSADRGLNSRGGLLRTGSIRPGNGVYGPGGDYLAGSYLARKYNPTWVKNIIQSFIYVENCALAHLIYEQRLLEMETMEGRPDIGGQAFNVADEQPPLSYKDVYEVLSTLTNGETKFPSLPPAPMLAMSHAMEAYSLARLWHPLLTGILPQIKGELEMLQPSLFSLTQVHLVFDDSRARRPAQEGGLGFGTAYSTLEGLCKLVIEHTKEESEWARARGDNRM